MDLTNSDSLHILIRGRLSVVEHVLGLLCKEVGITVDLDSIPMPSIPNDDTPQVSPDDALFHLRVGRRTAYERMSRAGDIDAPKPQGLDT